MKLNIIKKNRKYFAAITDSGYKCKVLIDENSENLELGEHILCVDDISIKSKYGIDLIYKLTFSAEENIKQEIVTLKSDYNSMLVDECRKLGGTWDGQVSAWVFPAFVAEQVELLDDIYNSKLITIDITSKEEISELKSAITFIGRSICKAKDRDSGAFLYDGVALIKGNISSGGSAKNWRTYIDKNTVLRLQMPEKLLDLYDDERFDYCIVEQIGQ
ncbi:Uncharacterised protein [Vibrio cholerae]|nr:Uncharacterised protein [Vibrio cholerae]